MNFQPGNLYHVYNQGNNRQLIFNTNEDFLNFAGFTRKYLLPFTEIVAWCLMPNHFHFILSADERSNKIVRQGGNNIDIVTNGIRKLLSGYARVYNNKYHRIGSLFRPKTKSKCLTDISSDVSFKKKYKAEEHYSACFHYIHQNPLKAGLVEKLEDWEYSSFKDYAGMRNGTLCNKELATKLCLYSSSDFIEVSYKQIPDDFLNTLK
jgi:REP element-mobilizing transposase RayT